VLGDQEIHMKYLYALLIAFLLSSTVVTSHDEDEAEQDAFVERQVRDHEQNQQLEVPDVNEWDD